MFVVYNSQTKCVIQQHENDTLSNLMVKIIEDELIVISCYLQDDLVINLNNIINTKTSVKCNVSLCNKFLVQMNCLDCGTLAAKWVSKCVNIQ